jgi:hypothetical protein
VISCCDDNHIVEQNGVYTGCCVVARNPIRPSVAAAYSIFAAQPQALRQLLAKAIETYIEHRCANLLVELGAEHRHFEPPYVDLGFRKEIEYAMCEKRIA